MSDRWREVGDSQAAFLQAEGKLRPKVRPKHKNATARPLDPNHRALARIFSPSRGLLCIKLAAHLAA